MLYATKEVGRLSHFYCAQLQSQRASATASLTAEDPSGLLRTGVVAQVEDEAGGTVLVSAAHQRRHLFGGS